MKIQLWYIGKTNHSFVADGVAVYAKRLQKYIQFEEVCLPDCKPAPTLRSVLQEKEAHMVLQRLKSDDFLMLLDEKGATFTSEKFAVYIERLLAQSSAKRLIFLVGGAYGFAPALYERANAQLALSAMTFSHQLIRLVFMEQLYRAFTILHNEPYHNA